MNIFSRISAAAAMFTISMLIVFTSAPAQDNAQAGTDKEVAPLVKHGKSITIDRLKNAKSEKGVESRHEYPRRSVPSATSSGNAIYDNGPLVNLPGGGAGGADASVLQSTSLGMTVTSAASSVQGLPRCAMMNRVSG